MIKNHFFLQAFMLKSVVVHAFPWFELWDTNQDSVWSKDEIYDMVGTFVTKQAPNTVVYEKKSTWIALVDDFVDSLNPGGSNISISNFLDHHPLGDQHLPGQVRVTPASEGTLITWVQTNSGSEPLCVSWCHDDSCTTYNATTWSYTVPPRWYDNYSYNSSNNNAVIMEKIRHRI